MSQPAKVPWDEMPWDTAREMLDRMLDRAPTTYPLMRLQLGAQAGAVLAALRRIDELSKPIPMLLPCPNPDCKLLHVDEGEWATRPHRTHLCAACGETWRPALVNTVGVVKLAVEPPGPGS